MNKKQKLTEIIRSKVRSAINEVQSKKKIKLEGTTVANCKYVEKDDLGHFWIVMGIDQHSTDGNVYETDLFNFTEQVQNGKIKLENIKGIYKKEDRARRIGERLVKERKAAINDAKKSADNLKSLRDEVANKAKDLKKQKVETQKVVGKLSEKVAPLSVKQKTTISTAKPVFPPKKK